MKLLFLFIFFAPLIVSQENQEIKQCVKDFFELANLYAERYNIDKESIKAYSNEEIKTLARKYYEAKAEDPIGFNNYIENEAQDLKKDSNNKMSPKMRTGTKVGIVKRIIAAEYGNAYAEIIDVPYFLRGKILDIRQDKFESKTEGILLPKVVLKVEVEEIIKGKNKFKEKEVLEINFLSHWMRGSTKSFVVGNSYLIPIRPWNCYNGICEALALSILPDNNFGIYIIENNFIKTDNDYFLLGKKKKWNEFKKEFINWYLF